MSPTVRNRVNCAVCRSVLLQRSLHVDLSAWWCMQGLMILAIGWTHDALLSGCYACMMMYHSSDVSKRMLRLALTYCARRKSHKFDGSEAGF